MSDKTYPTEPDPACPKCGHQYGFDLVDPTYRGPTSDYPPSDGEYLEWTCRYCGFTIRTKTADAR